MRRVEDHRQRRRGERALRWLVVLWLAVLLGFFLFPLPLGGEGGKVWVAVHGLCAQTPGHMLLFADLPLPLCARDSGIYLGVLLGAVYLLARGRWRAAGRPARWFWGLFIATLLLLGVDVANSIADDWFGRRLLYPRSNVLSLASGVLLGVVLAVVLLWVIHMAFASRQVGQPIVTHWLDLAGLLLTAAAGGVALASGWPPLYVPLMVLSVGGMVATLLAANSLAILSLTRGRELLGSYWEALPPLLWGSLAAVVEMALLALLRYRLGV
jgi:uncharacterized membrane protein